MKRTLIAVFSSAALVVLGGCSSGSDDSAPAVTTMETSAAPTVTCESVKPIEDAAFAAALATVPLPTGAQLTTGRISADSDLPGQIATAVVLCDPAVTTADDLRPIATQYAKALKASPLAKAISAVYVESYQVDGSVAVNNVKLKDGDFQLNLWNGKPSESAENARWEAIAGQ